MAHEWLGLLLSEAGRDREAVEHAETAVRLDPFEATMYQARGMIHYNARRFADAIQSERRALELQPSLPLARVLLVKSQTLAGDARSALETCGPGAGDDGLTVACAGAAVSAGNRARFAVLPASLASRRLLPEGVLAQVDAVAGDYAAAFMELEALAARGSLAPGLGFDPFFDELRRQPGWRALAAKLPPRSATPTRD